MEGYYKGCKITAPEIASKYNMNVRAILPALRALTKAGILISQTGGNEPGFIFARDPKTISMFEIIILLEGNLKMYSCHQVVNGICCDLKDCNNCLIYNGVNNALESIRTTLRSVSVYDHFMSIEKDKECALAALTKKSKPLIAETC